MILQELDDVLENMVCWLVGAAFLPPTLDNSAVVPIDHDVVSFLRALAYADNEKFEADCFSPLDVSPIGLPIGSKLPHSPLCANRDRHADARASVGVGSVFNEGLGFWDGGENVSTAELELPPGKVIWGVSGRGAWKERVVIAGGKHGLHAGEVSPSCHDHT